MEWYILCSAHTLVIGRYVHIIFKTKNFLQQLYLKSLLFFNDTYLISTQFFNVCIQIKKDITYVMKFI